jgi:hypothetical protein
MFLFGYQEKVLISLCSIPLIALLFMRCFVFILMIDKVDNVPVHIGTELLYYKCGVQ